MLRWTIIFFVLAVVAAVFGFGGVSETFADFGRILFFLFVAIAVISALMNMLRR